MERCQEMHEIHRQVLQTTLTYLQKNLDTTKIIDCLYEAEILFPDHIDRLKAEVGEYSRVSLLIRILPRRGPEAFPAFMKALEKTGQEYVKSTLVEQQKRLHQTKIETDQNKQIGKWLRSRLAISQTEAGVQLQDLHKFIVENSPVDLHGRNLTLRESLSIAKEIFPNGNAVPDVELIEECKLPNEILYVELTEPAISDISPIQTTNQFSPTHLVSSERPSTMDTWTVDDVYQWLLDIGRSEKVAEIFREEEIDGSALILLNIGHLKDHFHLKFADCLKIIAKRDDHLKDATAVTSNQQRCAAVELPERVCNAVDISQNESDSSSSNLQSTFDSSSHGIDDDSLFAYMSGNDTGRALPKIEALEQCDDTTAKLATLVVSETCKKTVAESCESIVNLKQDELILNLPPSKVLRNFDTPVEMTFKYMKNSRLSCIESRPGGNLLLPVHRFVQADLSTNLGLLEFAKESVKFACACLNERTNGTIHFGIESSKVTRQSVSFGGEIVGTKLRKDFKRYEDFFTKALKNCFCEDQIDCVRSCVGVPVFIEVVPREGDSLFVVEIDVIAKHSCCEDLAFYAKLPTEEKGRFDCMAMYRIIDGTPRSLVNEEIARFMAIKDKLAEDRSGQEKKAKSIGNKDLDINKDLCRKFVHLLCDGEDNIRGDHYRILVINEPDEYMNEEWMNENLSFIADIEWKAVFDFDSEARICKLLQKRDEVVKIVMSDEFSDRSSLSNSEHLRQLHDDIRNSVYPSWIFVNGYSVNPNEEKLSPVQWKIRKSDGFKEAVRFFKSEIPPGRATVVFLLFSKDTKVILESAEEFVTCFPDHWMCVAETENIGKPWVEELMRRNCVESVDERVVLGMPWNHIKVAVNKIHNPKPKMVCELPTSAGTTVVLKPGVKNELFDLDILGSTECDREFETADQEQRDQLKAKAEIDFYRGDSPSWWNFYIPNQVCKRDIDEELQGIVRRTLAKKCDDCLEKVCIYHQPGSGGTTSARHVLWKLRKIYRVGIVRNITDHQTAEQIVKLYQYGDDSPMPILLLLDNPDEERANLLLVELDELAKNLRKRGDSQYLPICVFLVCWRRTKVPQTYDYVKDKTTAFEPRRVTLKHELSDRERDWFIKKAKTLQTHFDRKDALFVDPRLLISFNIMKANFDKEFIKRMVKDFVEDITDINERTLLKYISLVNAFDLQQRPLPSAAFDSMMVKLPWQAGLRYGKRAISNRWENKLSDAIRILMNETSKPAMGYIHSMRITNPLLSKEILNVLIAASGGKETICDIALDFLNCKDIFAVKSVARHKLLCIIKDVLKQRGRLPNGLPETHFSPLIQEIFDKEGVDKASAVLEKGFALADDDPFIAQQIARLFIKSQNWDNAAKYAKFATDLKPENSCLWDTFGRIYEQQLLEEYTKLESCNRDVPMHELAPIVYIGLKGLDMFHKVQEISDEEKTSAPNNAGYFGELQMILCLLNCLTHAECFKTTDDLRQFILDEKFVPGDISILTDVYGRNCLEELKMLSQKVDKATNRIEDELIQLRGDMVVDNKRKHYRYAEDVLIRLKEHLNLYFGEENDQPPADITDIDAQCQYRRRRIFRLAGTNLRSIFDLRWTTSGQETLERIFNIVYENINTQHADAYDFMTMINVNLALTSMGPAHLYNKKIKFEDMVSWTKKLYDLRETMHSSHLEPYLFLTMFNWPRRNTKQFITPKRIEVALRQWKDAYYRKYPRQRDEGTGKMYRKKDTTLFFLANGSDMASIYTMYEERGMREHRGDRTFWRKPDTLRNLQRFKGLLSSGGMEVSVQLQDAYNNKSNINILTSLPIFERHMWNHEVYFVIGFSWIGPKAFDVTLEDPTMIADMSEDHQVLKPAEPLFTFTTGIWNRRWPLIEIQREHDLKNKLEEVKNNLKLIQQIKKYQMHRTLTTQEKKMLGMEDLYNNQLFKLLQEKKMLMQSMIPEFS